MAEDKKITLHPLKADGSVDANTNLYPKTNNIIDASGNAIDVQEKLVAGENIIIENNVISSTGGGITIPTFDAYFEDEPEFEDFKLTQENLNDIWENKYPLINIRVTIDVEEEQTIQYVICFKLSHNVVGLAMTYAMTSMEFGDDEGHQNDLNCMAFIIALNDDTNLPTIVAVNEEYYTNDYRNLENKPSIPEIDTEIGPESLDDRVPSSKCVYDYVENHVGGKLYLHKLQFTAPNFGAVPGTSTIGLGIVSSNPNPMLRGHQSGDDYLTFYPDRANEINEFFSTYGYKLIIQTTPDNSTSTMKVTDVWSFKGLGENYYKLYIYHKLVSEGDTIDYDLPLATPPNGSEIIVEL